MKATTEIELMTLQDGAEQVGVALCTLRFWIDSGRIPPEAVKRFPGSSVVRLDRDLFNKWLNSLHAGSR